MKVHHLRNATFVIESKDRFILVDPMLGEKGSLPPFSFIRHKVARNPLVPLPDNAPWILDKVSHCLITHSHTFGLKALQHTDHLDKAGENFLKSKNTPVACRGGDAGYLEKSGLNVAVQLEFWKAQPFLGGKITAVPARHGHGWIHKTMANGAGYVLELPGEPSIYISGDTVYTEDVEKTLRELKPDIAVVASGSARMDVGGPILMPLHEILEFVANSPKWVIANHLEALNHCSTTRSLLRQELQKQNFLKKTFIPEDGDIIPISID